MQDSTTECVCLEGYAGDPYNVLIGCIDIDECKDPSNHTCDNENPVSNCYNSVGSYVCECPDGYERIAGHAGICIDIDECKTGLHLCNLGLVRNSEQ